ASGVNFADISARPAPDSADAGRLACVVANSRAGLRRLRFMAPRLMHELCVAAIAGQVTRAMEIQLQLLPLHKALFVESNPIPVKWAAARMGLCGHALRLPLTPLSPGQQPSLERVMHASGLI
ncbi:MAG TPA: dihydrodipicolinate synthase family protein, partial [Rhodoferax sp.]|nr:dihydrodipicolinate synthase family protein [Rhodoferax sp.]